MTAKGLNLLVAYPYMTPDLVATIKANAATVRFVLDSGAFTAWKAGKEIKLDDYCRYIESLPFEPWRYFVLDVIGNPKATMDNYETMLKRGFKPVPIFTRGEDPSCLDDYYKTSDVVGIGGLVGTQGNKGFVKGIMGLVGQRKCHWLGFTNLNYVKHYRPYMCDSSTWEMGARYGQITVYMGGGQCVLLRQKTIVQDLKKPAIVTAIKALGFDPYSLMKKEHWAGSYTIARRMGAKSWVRLSQDCGKNLGVNMFLAAANDYGAKMLLEGDR